MESGNDERVRAFATGHALILTLLAGLCQSPASRQQQEQT